MEPLYSGILKFIRRNSNFTHLNNTFWAETPPWFRLFARTQI